MAGTRAALQSLVVGAAALAWAWRAGPVAGQTAPDRSGVPVAFVAFAENGVERGDSDGQWDPIREGTRMRTGERLRTGPEGVARIEFPWMKLSLGPSSTLSIPAGLVQSMVLEQGRVEILSEGDIIKLLAGDVEVRGQGRAVVRRTGETTTAAAREGSFRVRAAGRTVTIETRQGTIAAAGGAPSPPESLPDPPRTLDPGSDPRYAKEGEPVSLSWGPSGGRHHVQILGINSDVILIERDVGDSPQSFAIPWLGTFRWRVSTRDEKGLEGLPSAEGLVCVVER